MKLIVGIPEQNRDEAAALYWEAFGTKLGFVLGPRYAAIHFISSVMRSDHGICAVDDSGRLLGVVGFKTHEGALVGGGFRDLRAVYGWISGAIRHGLLNALESETENKRFVMDGLFVAPEARGQGIGSALLHAIAEEARTRGYRQVRLDVIDSNHRARMLYLHHGYYDLNEQKLGLLRYVFGFKSSTSMVCDL